MQPSICEGCILSARERYIIGAFAAGETLLEGVSVELKRKYPIFVRSKNAGLGCALIYSDGRALGIVVVDGDLSSRVEGGHCLDDRSDVCGRF